MLASVHIWRKVVKQLGNTLVLSVHLCRVFFPNVNVVHIQLIHGEHAHCGQHIRFARA